MKGLALTRWTVSLLLGVSSVAVGQSSARTPSPDFAAFDRYVAKAAEDWHIPGLAIAVVHNRLLTPMVLDMASFAGLARPMRNAITAARHAGALAVPRYGARYREAGQQTAKKRLAGRR